MSNLYKTLILTYFFLSSIVIGVSFLVEAQSSSQPIGIEVNNEYMLGEFDYQLRFFEFSNNVEFFIDINNTIFIILNNQLVEISSFTINEFLFVSSVSLNNTFSQYFFFNETKIVYLEIISSFIFITVENSSYPISFIIPIVDFSLKQSFPNIYFNDLVKSSKSSLSQSTDWETIDILYTRKNGFERFSGIMSIFTNQTNFYFTPTFETPISFLNHFSFIEALSQNHVTIIGSLGSNINILVIKYLTEDHYRLELNYTLSYVGDQVPSAISYNPLNSQITIFGSQLITGSNTRFSYFMSNLSFEIVQATFTLDLFSSFNVDVFTYIWNVEIFDESITSLHEFSLPDTYQWIIINYTYIYKELIRYDLIFFYYIGMSSIGLFIVQIYLRRKNLRGEDI